MKRCIKLLACTSILGFSSLFADAQSKTYDPHCLAKMTDQTGLDDCARSQAKHADAQMNRIYQELCAQLASDPKAKAKVIASQKAWLTYRDSYIEAMYPEEDKQLHYGTRFPMDAELLIADLTRTQTKALIELLRNYQNP
jgi:uncharacterized protein YecT (DUF1311 family)